jgi:hypothetical protein
MRHSVTAILAGLSKRRGHGSDLKTNYRFRLIQKHRWRGITHTCGRLWDMQVSLGCGLIRRELPHARHYKFAGQACQRSGEPGRVHEPGNSLAEGLLNGARGDEQTWSCARMFSICDFRVGMSCSTTLQTSSFPRRERIS